MLRRSIFFMSIEVGSKLQGKVTGITNFGAFVELPGGSTGLVHISEVADNYVKDINDFLKVGDAVEVKVINIESNGKIGLSIKQAKDRPERPEREERRPRPRGNNNQRRSNKTESLSFEDKLNNFLKASEERQASLKRHVEKRNGRSR